MAELSDTNLIAKKKKKEKVSAFVSFCRTHAELDVLLHWNVKRSTHVVWQGNIQKQLTCKSRKHVILFGLETRLAQKHNEQNKKLTRWLVKPKEKFIQYLKHLTGSQTRKCSPFPLTLQTKVKRCFLFGSCKTSRDMPDFLHNFLQFLAGCSIDHLKWNFNLWLKCHLSFKDPRLDTFHVHQSIKILRSFSNVQLVFISLLISGIAGLQSHHNMTNKKKNKTFQ